MTRDDPTPAVENTTAITEAREWDGLAPQTVLAVAALLRLGVCVAVGALELALPYWLLALPANIGGLGGTPPGNGAADLATAAAACALARSRKGTRLRSAVNLCSFGTIYAIFLLHYAVVNMSFLPIKLSNLLDNLNWTQIWCVLFGHVGNHISHRIIFSRQPHFFLPTLQHHE